MLVLLAGFGACGAWSQTARTTELPPAVEFAPWQRVRSDEVSDEYTASFPSAYPSPHPENQTVPVRIILPSSPTGPVPVVVLLHYWGAADQRVEERMAAQFARRKIGTVLIALPYHLGRTPKGTTSGSLAIQPDPTKLRDVMIQSVWDVRRTLDFLATRPEIDRNRIGLAGISLGAIVGALVAGVEPRFTHLCFLFGGADIAGLLWNSSRVVKQREELRRRGYTEAVLREELAEIEPSTYLQAAPRRPALVVGGRYDTVVPRHSTDALIESLGTPLVRWINTGHFGGFFVERSIIGAVGEFFQSGFYGTARTSIANIRLNAPTIRVGALYDSADQLQTVAGADLWRANARGDFFLSGVVGPRGPKLYLGLKVAPGLSVGVSASSRRVSPGLLWSIVL